MNIWIGRRLAGYRKAKTFLPIRYEMALPGGSAAVINNSLTIQLPDTLKKRFDYQFGDNGDCLEEIKDFLTRARETNILFDIGAAEGLFSILFCLTRQQNLAYAFEPSPALFPSVRQNALANGVETRIHCINKALGQSEGKMTGKILPKGYVGLFQSSAGADAPVELSTLDDECERLGVYPDILKIDVDGYESEVLQGAVKLLSVRKPLIFLEFHLDCLEERKHSPLKILKRLEQCGYRFFDHTGRPWSSRRICGSLNSVCRFTAIHSLAK